MAAKADTLRKSVYGSLKSMILSGQLAAGMHVTENELSSRLGVSRTPIREALNRLERDGLVHARPRQGFIVGAFDLEMFRNVFEIREVLDGLAAECAAERATEANHREMQTILDDCKKLATLPERSMPEMLQELQLGMELHRKIAESTGNKMLLENVSGILDKCQYYVWTELVWHNDWSIMRSEHEALVAAICARDTELAGVLARQHVRGARDDMFKMLKAKADFQTFAARATA